MEHQQKEMDYQRTIHTLNVGLDKVTEQRDSAIKRNTQLEKQIEEISRERNTDRTTNLTSVTNLNQDINRLRRDVEGKNETISELRDTVQEMRIQLHRIPQMERELRDLSETNRRNLNLLQTKDSSYSKLQWEYNLIKKEKDEMEERLQEAESEIEQLEEGGEVDSELDLYEEPLVDTYLEDDEKILKLVKGGGLNVADIEKLIKTKNSIDKTIDKAIDDALIAGNGRIKEDELQKMQGVEFDRSKITITAKVGSKLLRRNFLSPTYSLVTDER